MDKKHLRQTFRKKRVELSERERQERSAAICDTAIDFIDADWSTVHCFAPITRLKEVDTTAILRYAIHCPQLRLICSVSHFDSLEMLHYEVPHLNFLQENNWGIPEPDTQRCASVSIEEISAVFIPLLACDASGNRLGYGKGFYDRFLAGLSPSVALIGLSFFPPIQTALAKESHDILLHSLITPEAIYRF